MNRFTGIFSSSDRLALAFSAAIVAAAAAAPIRLIRFLPLNDFPFHLARIAILSDLDAPFRDQFYDMGSFLLPNMALDLVAWPLAKAIGPEAAVEAFMIVLAFGFIGGAVALHYAAHGNLSAWPLLAGAFLFNGIFRFGFLNYLFGLGVGFFLAAAWIAMRPGVARLAVAFAGSVLMIMLHLSAFGVYAIICGAFELHRAIRGLRAGGGLRAIGLHLAVSAAPFLAALAVFAAASPTASEAAAGVKFASYLGHKPLGAYYSLSTGLFWLDAIIYGAIAAIVAVLAWRRMLTVSQPLGLATLILLIVFLAMPTTILGSHFADVRLGPPLAVLALLACAPRTDRLSARARLALTAAPAALAVLIAAALTPIWIEYDHKLSRSAAAFDILPTGAVIFSATALPYPRLIAQGAERRAAWTPPLKHVVAYAALTREVFAPEIFADPTKQPLVVAPDYAPVKYFQGDNPYKVKTIQDAIAWIDRIQRRRQSADWPDIPNAYVLITGIDRVSGWPDRLAPYIAAQGENFAILALPPTASLDTPEPAPGGRP